jgi:hypothetical protein
MAIPMTRVEGEVMKVNAFIIEGARETVVVDGMLAGRAHGHRLPSRQRRCARGQPRRVLPSGIGTPLGGVATDGATVGADPELSASVLQLPALRAHRVCKKGEHRATERSFKRCSAS